MPRNTLGYDIRKMLASTLLTVLPLLGAAYAAPPSKLVRHRRTMSSDMSSGSEASSGGMMSESGSMDSGVSPQSFLLQSEEGR